MTQWFDMSKNNGSISKNWHQKSSALLKIFFSKLQKIPLAGIPVPAFCPQVPSTLWQAIFNQWCPLNNSRNMPPGTQQLAWRTFFCGFIGSASLFLPQTSPRTSNDSMLSTSGILLCFDKWLGYWWDCRLDNNVHTIMSRVRVALIRPSCWRIGNCPTSRVGSVCVEVSDTIQQAMTKTNKVKLLFGLSEHNSIIEIGT